MQQLDTNEWVTASWVVEQFSDSFSNKINVFAFVNSGKIRSKKVNGVIYVPIEDVTQCDQFLKELKRDYFNLHEMNSNLGHGEFRPYITPVEKVKEFCISEGIAFKEFDIPLLHLRFFINKTDFLEFRERYLTHDEVVQMLGVCKRTFYTIPDVRKVFIKGDVALYSKDDLERALGLSSRINLNSGEYYTTEEVCSILGFPVSIDPYGVKRFQSWVRYKKTNNIPHFRSMGGTAAHYYRKTDIDRLIARQQEYRRLHYTPSEIKEKISINCLNKNGIKGIKTDGLMRAAFNDSRLLAIYLKTEMDSFFENWLSNKDLKAQLSQIDYEGSLIEAFERRLKTIDEPCEANSESTRAWFAYCRKKLIKVGFNKNLTTRQMNVTYYIECTVTLFKFLKNRELPSIGASEINFSLLRLNNLAAKPRGILYSFCIEFFKKLKDNNEQVAFKKNQLHNPYNEEPETRRVKEIYQFDEYLNLINYATDLNIHKEKAIEDAIKKISKKQTTDYASAWLYVLISVNNAWRHTDIIYNLTQLDLERLKIRSIEQLREKDVTLCEAKAVISQIMAKDNSHTKTNATAQFNCSDEVAIPLATAAIICTLIAQKLHLGKEIVCFTNQGNKFTNSISKAFFAEFKGTFDFKILKMNRSLLTFTYLILLKKGYGGAALEVAKRLRGHYGFETTNIYLQIPQEKLNELVAQLFARRNFGYIQHTFLNILYGSEEDREKRTADIVALNSRFNVHQTTATSGFLIKISSEKQTVMEKILTMGFDEAREMMFKLSANLLPSKEKDVQCLISETNCEDGGREKCHGCSYAIPNFYVITTIVQSFTVYCKKFKEASKTNATGPKNKLNNLLYKEITLLQEASDTFGYDVVMSFFQGGEEEYESLLALLDEGNSFDAYNYLTSKQEEKNGYYNAGA